MSIFEPNIFDKFNIDAFISLTCNKLEVDPVELFPLQEGLQIVLDY